MTTGIILTGHGRFAQGLASAVELIAGKQEHFICVDFEHELDELEHDMEQAINALSDCEDIIVFADLAGGSPFKTAGMFAYKDHRIDVIAGANLPMICETVHSRAYITEGCALTMKAVKVGSMQIMRLDMKELLNQSEPEHDEGI